MKKIINNSGGIITTSIGNISNGQIAELKGRELETCLKIKGVELLESKEVKESKKSK